MGKKDKILKIWVRYGLDMDIGIVRYRWDIGKI